jgi:hypothetical protein
MVNQPRTSLALACALCVVLVAFNGVSLAAEAVFFNPASNRLVDSLAAQGVPASRILGLDAHGIPIVCGTDSGTGIPATSGGATSKNLSGGLLGWEVIPSVIRRNGVDTCRVEVDAGGPVSQVTLDVSSVYLTPDSGGSHQILRDDGLGGDRVAGDNIWTSVTFHANPGGFPPVPIGGDDNSPVGIEFGEIGSVNVIELTGETNGFLINPQVGMMEPQVPIATPMALSSNFQVMPHVLNIQGTSQAAQRFLRVGAGDIIGLIKTFYATVPDAFDFLTFFTVDHVEQPPATSSGNFTAGRHAPVKVNYTGTGLTPYDSTSSYGSAGRLLGFSVLDTDERGVFSGNAMHEQTHQWCSFTDTSLGLNDGTGHYSYFTGAASLVGGVQFIATNGGYYINCSEGSGGAHHAPPLDKYMMGFLEASNVPPIPIASSSGPSPSTVCNGVLPTSDISSTVTIDQIQQIEGVRTPTPANSQHDFTLGFVIESKNRMLSPTELTFYEILGRQVTQPWPASQPDPYVGPGWVPVANYFGSGTTWRSYITSFVEPSITFATPVPGDSVAVGGVGFPRASYTLLGSSNLVSWQTVAMLRADTNGVFQCMTDLPGPVQFYRVVWNE